MNQMLHAWKSKDSNKTAINNNKYSCINEIYLKTHETILIKLQLEIIEYLENNILTISNFKTHLEKYTEFKNYDNIINDIRSKNNKVNKYIHDIEEKIYVLLIDIQDLTNRTKAYDDVDIKEEESKEN